MSWHTPTPLVAHMRSVTRTSTMCWTPGLTSTPRSTSSTWRVSTTRSANSPESECARHCRTPYSASADEVVLVDVTPQSLIERLLAGKVYRPEAIQPALDNFFKIENLNALREVALRQVAEDVEAKRFPTQSALALRPNRPTRTPDRYPGAAGDRRAPAGADHAASRRPADRSSRVALSSAPGSGTRHPLGGAFQLRTAEQSEQVRRDTPPGQCPGGTPPGRNRGMTWPL